MRTSPYGHDWTRRLAVPAAVVCLGLTCFLPTVDDACARARLEGYYETEAVAENDNSLQEGSRWIFNPMRHLYEFKFSANPHRRFDIWTKFNGDNNNVDRNLHVRRFWLIEGHARVFGDGWEAIAFTKEDRYWMANVLSHFFTWADGSRLRTGDNMGIRLQRWNWWHGLNATVIYSDFSGNVEPAEDGKIVKIDRYWEKQKLFLAGYWVRKDWNERTADGEVEYDSADNNQVFGLDIRWNRGFEWAMQLGHSEIPGDRVWGTSDNSWAFATEIRNLRAGPFQLKLSHRNYGKEFFNYLSGALDAGGQQGRRYYNGEFLYGLPNLAVTTRVSYEHYDQDQVGTTRDQSVDNVFGEVYVEWIHGFASRVYYQKTDNIDGRWKHLFGEFLVENFLAKLKAQFKIRNMDTRYEEILYGIDLGFKLSDKFKANVRAMTSDHRKTVLARQSLWAQGIYHVGDQMELTFDYGPSWHGDNDLVNDGSFAGSQDADITHRFAMKLRAWW
ncbi:MAG: hypothetical protein KAW17_04745 [Candidatus Eisenbacteria sp.]|nr:hypothetical protein [Candidatus Eisenbacteria bacterium]